MRIRTFFFASACALALLVPGTAPALAANALSPQAYLQYTPTYGDTYNGVTTDDGDHLAGSYAAKVKVFYGRFAAMYTYYRDFSRSVAKATLPSGAPGTALNYPGGTAIVPVFTASDAESEIRLEYKPLRFPIYAGVAYSNSFNSYNFPRLTAVGIGVELHPDPNRLLSPYGSYFFFPNQAGTYPHADPNNPSSGPIHSAFRANEIDFGASVAFPKTDVSFVVGVHQITNVRRTGIFNFVRVGPYVGLGYRIK